MKFSARFVESIIHEGRSDFPRRRRVARPGAPAGLRRLARRPSPPRVTPCDPASAALASSRRQLPALPADAHGAGGEHVHRDGRAAAAGGRAAVRQRCRTAARRGAERAPGAGAGRDERLSAADRPRLDTLYLQALNTARGDANMPAADALMRDAIRALVQWQVRVDATWPAALRRCAAAARARTLPRLVRDARVRHRLDELTSSRRGSAAAICWSTARSPSRPSRSTATGCRAT